MNQGQQAIVALCLGVTCVRDMAHLLDVLGFARFLGGVQ